MWVPRPRRRRTSSRPLARDHDVAPLCKRGWIVRARPDARSFKTVHIESYYGPGVLRDVFINVAAQMGKWALRKTESCRCAQAETK